MNLAREAAATARRHADAGEIDFAIASLAEVAREAAAGRAALDTRMRFFEVVGVLERSGIDSREIHDRLRGLA